MLTETHKITAQTFSENLLKERYRNVIDSRKKNSGTSIDLVCPLVFQKP
jgi:hypothetical protein